MAKSPDRNSEPSQESATVPQPVVSRLSLYLRELQRLRERGRETVSSTQLGSLLGFTDTQVRKDLAYFGQFGYPGIGYRCHELIDAIRRILGTHRTWKVALVGLGNLGRALLRYRGFDRQGFRIAVAFDVSPQLVGRTIEGVPVRHMDELPEAIEQARLRLAIITVPAEQAPPVADALIAAGVEGILNFAPVTLTVPPHVNVVGVDLAIELEQLTYSVTRSGEEAT